MDKVILKWFHSIKNPYLTTFFSSITWLGSLWILLPFYLISIIAIDVAYGNFEQILGITFFGSVISTYVLKYTLERQRPHLFKAISDLPIDPSFPSAHTTQITAFFLGVWLFAQGINHPHQDILALLFIVIIIAVALSRIYLQVHFPSDVLAGLLMAILWGSIALLLPL